MNTRVESMIYLNGRDKPSFRCDTIVSPYSKTEKPITCSCNVFTKTIEKGEQVYTCNSCQTRYIGS